MPEFRTYYECTWVRMEYVCESGCLEPIDYAKTFASKDEAMSYYEKNKQLKERIKWTVSKRNIDHVIQYYVNENETEKKSRRKKKTEEAM